MKAIGLDIGTTTICGVLMEADTGAVLRQITLPNDSALETGRPDEKLQDVQVIEKRCRTVLQKLYTGGAGIGCIGVTGQMHGIVYVDRTGKAVSPLITWQDGRGDRPCAGGESCAEQLSRLTGYPLAGGYGSVTHYYNTLYGQIPDGASCFCTIADYVTQRLAGRKRPLLHASMAASLGLFSLERKCFDTEKIQLAGMDPKYFPQLQPAEGPIGCWNGEVAVSAALGDNQASFLGAMDGGSEVLVNVGTGSQISVLGRELRSFPSLECRPYLGETYLYVGASLCGGYAYSMLRRFFEDVLHMCGAGAAGELYTVMNEAGRAAKERPVPPLQVDVRFRGSRREPGRRGKIEAIGAENFGAGDLVLGVLRGICRELFAFYGEIGMGEKPACLMGSGNGIRSNPLLRELLSEQFETEVRIPPYAEEAACGAAKFARLYAERSTGRQL